MAITVGTQCTISFNGVRMYVGAFYSTTATGGMFRGIDLRTGATVDSGISWEMEGRTIVPN